VFLTLYLCFLCCSIALSLSQSTWWRVTRVILPSNHQQEMHGIRGVMDSFSSSYWLKVSSLAGGGDERSTEHRALRRPWAETRQRNAASTATTKNANESVCLWTDSETDGWTDGRTNRHANSLTVQCCQHRGIK
jgi:hypothetical protein